MISTFNAGEVLSKIWNGAYKLDGFNARIKVLKASCADRRRSCTKRLRVISRNESNVCDGVMKVTLVMKVLNINT